MLFENFSVFNMFVDFLTWLFDKLGGLQFISAFSDIVSDLYVEYPSLSGFVDCLSATIKLFTPVNVFVFCVGLKLGAWGLSFFFSVLWRLKSLIPTMGN